MNKLPVLALFHIFSNIAAFSQVPTCPTTFVADFWTADGEQTVLTHNLTDDLETALLNSGCPVLLRADHPELTQQLNSAAAAGQLPEALRAGLETAEARQLISGTVRPDNSGSARVSVTILDLTATQAAKTKTLQFSELELQKNEYRQAKLAQLVGTPAGVVTAGRGTAAAAPPAVLIDSEEDALWQQIAQKPAEKNVRSYLVKYPEGQYLTKIESMVWGECLATKRTGKCKDYVKLFPDGAHVEVAQQIIADNEAQVKAFMATPGPPSSSPADPKKMLPAKSTPTSGRDSAKASPKPDVYHEIVIVVGKKVEALAVLPGYRNLKLNTRKDGNREARVQLQKGSYEMKVYEKGGVLKCNKPFTVNGPRTISSPCQGG